MWLVGGAEGGRAVAEYLSDPISGTRLSEPTDSALCVCSYAEPMFVGYCRLDFKARVRVPPFLVLSFG